MSIRYFTTLTVLPMDSFHDPDYSDFYYVHRTYQRFKR